MSIEELPEIPLDLSKSPKLSIPNGKSGPSGSAATPTLTPNPFRDLNVPAWITKNEPARPIFDSIRKSLNSTPVVYSSSADSGPSNEKLEDQTMDDAPRQSGALQQFLAPKSPGVTQNDSNSSIPAPKAQEKSSSWLSLAPAKKPAPRIFDQTAVGKPVSSPYKTEVNFGVNTSNLGRPQNKLSLPQTDLGRSLKDFNHNFNKLSTPLYTLARSLP